ncbi:response regulator [Bradyrhizobium sp. Ash2021]|uniref:response regulator transcription factor n=1 Tax=Bradyrhizobium sp. Ash2021 TaxID=2954771 RepID=UPI002815D797|nr:response regulator [Bradyrhizobium sp. Ash2021]WMT77042.1 response regulator [Bradyrhizobium sp. Ash2021]
MIEIPLISIVDDDDLFRAAIEKLVKSLGLVARTFSSAESYLQSSWVKTTRCLIADMQMPNMSGLELQEHLSHLGFDIPIIFITAYPDDAVRARAMNAGAVCFLHKPIDLQGRRLADCLQDALSRAKRPSPGA